MGKSKNIKNSDSFSLSKETMKRIDDYTDIQRTKVNFILSRFEEMKSLLAKCDEFITPPEDNLSESKHPLVRPLPWLTNVPAAVDGKPITGAVGYAIECIRACAQIGGDDGDKVAINLTGDFLNNNSPGQSDFNKTVFKVQTWDGTKYPLRRMVVRVQFTPTIVRYLYINEEDFYSAMLNVICRR